MARQQARRRQRERLTGIVLAMLGLVVLVVAVIAITQPKDGTENAAAETSTGRRTVTRSAPGSTASSKHAPTRPTSPGSGGASVSPGNDPASSSESKKVPLVVLNSTSISGLAKDAADRFRNGGWTVSDTGNLQNEILSTCAYYDPSDTSAKTAARALRKQFPVIKRIKAKFPELPSGPVVVVLTPDYSAD